MLWGGMSSCAQHHNNKCLERLVLRSAPHVFRRGRYKAMLIAGPNTLDSRVTACRHERTRMVCLNNRPNMSDTPFALNVDGSARDPLAFQAALKADHKKLEALQTEPETLAVMLGDDIPAMQAMLRSAFQV